MTKINQTNEELNRHLRDSIGFLEASSASFDVGFLGEAKRLAATIRVLLHDTQKSQSLLGLLGIKNTLNYITTAIVRNTHNLLAHHGLVGFSFGAEGPSYWAPRGDGPPTRYNRPHCDFNTWWNEVVIIDRSGNSFTRRDLVLALANRDGGAHVDPQLDVNYAALTRGNSLGWIISDGANQQPLSDVELHSARQIAYELLQSLRSSGVSAT